MRAAEGKVTLAVNGGIGFGARITGRQLLTILKYIGEDKEMELTTFQQIYLEVPESEKESVIAELKQVGLSCYPVGSYVKSLRTCNFCKGELAEGMPIAKELNSRIAGMEVPVTLKPSYSGCPVGCGEPLVNDIAVLKCGERFDVFIGGKGKGLKAELGQLFKSNLKPNEVYDVVEWLIRFYKDNAKKKEDFYRFIRRIGVSELRLVSQNI